MKGASTGYKWKRIIPAVTFNTDVKPTPATLVQGYEISGWPQKPSQSLDESSIGPVPRARAAELSKGGFDDHRR